MEEEKAKRSRKWGGGAGERHAQEQRNREGGKVCVREWARGMGKGKGLRKGETEYVIFGGKGKKERK